MTLAQDIIWQTMCDDFGLAYDFHKKPFTLPPCPAWDTVTAPEPPAPANTDPLTMPRSEFLETLAANSLSGGRKPAPRAKQETPAPRPRREPIPSAPHTPDYTTGESATVYHEPDKLPEYVMRQDADPVTPEPIVERAGDSAEPVQPVVEPVASIPAPRVTVPVPAVEPEEPEALKLPRGEDMLPDPRRESRRADAVEPEKKIDDYLDSWFEEPESIAPEDRDAN